MLMTQDQTQSTNDPGAARLFGTQNNREILERLEQERSLVEVTCYGVGSALLSRVGFVLRRGSNEGNRLEENGVV